MAMILPPRLVSIVIVSLVLNLAICTNVIVAASVEGDPKNFTYFDLWASRDGETHLEECKMQNFSLKPYSALPQFWRSDFGGAPLEIIFTQLPLGFVQPPHTGPQPQFVVTLVGSWYVVTSDGTRMEFKPGDVFFQDNLDNAPTAKVPKHRSGIVGDIPCQQIIVQLNRTADVDNPCPF